MSHQLGAFVINGSAPDNGCWVQLPIRKEDFLWAVAAVGVTDPNKDIIRVTMVEPKSEVLTPRLKEPFDLNELNFLAAKLEQLENSGEEQRRTFHACLQAGRHCDSVAGMLNLLENLDHFDLQPAFSPEEYGAFHLDMAQDEFANEMDALENSETPSKTDFADYISDLERCLDIKSYGRLIAEREGGWFTDYGYLTESVAFQEVYRGAQNIPAEFQASPFPNTELFLKLENTDLTDVLTKMHEVSGCTDDLERNLEIFHRRRSADFLLLFTADKAVLSEAMHIYRAGTPSHDAFVGATDAKMFSVYVTDFQTDFIGDIREVDAAERRMDIWENSIHSTGAWAMTMEGENLTFTPEEWENVSAAERNSFDSWSRQFADSDFAKVRHHIVHQYDRDGFWAKPATLEQFYSQLAQDCPAKTERAPEEKSKSVLARITAARGKPQPHKTTTPKHRTDPER